MVRLDDLVAEPISTDALNAAVKAQGAPTRDVFERTAAAVRVAWQRLVEANSQLSKANSTRQVAEGQVAGVGKVLAAGGNYAGDDVLKDVAELRAYALRMREVRTRMMTWARESASKRGGEGEGFARTVINFLDGIEAPATLGP